MGQGLWAWPPREPAATLRSLSGLPWAEWSEYLAVEVAHLVQWDVLGSSIQVNHLLI